MADVRMRGICKRFKDVRVIENVDLDIEDGEFAVFVGPSGCGKSTLLRLIAGLEDVSEGELRIGGRVCTDIPPSKRGVSMVFQSYALYPHMTVYDNMAFGLRLARQDGGTVEQRVRKAAAVLQLDQLLTRLPRELSGGQRQRVAIGRAIVREPGVFLFDEPLSNLDAALRVQTRIEIARLHAQMNASMIYVTHDQVEAMTLADRIVLLNTGQAVLEHGRVAQAGPPLALYHTPASLFVAGFIGSPKMNFLPGEIEDAAAGHARVRLGGGTLVEARVDARSARRGEAVTVGIRPEHFGPDRAAPDGGGEQNAVLRGRAVYVEHLGESTFVHFATDHLDTLVTARYPGDVALEKGEAIAVGLPPENCHLFDATGRAFARQVTPEALRQRPPAAGSARAGARY